MFSSTLPAFSPALPEIFLAVMAMIVLLFGVFRKNGTARATSLFAVLVLAAAVVLVIQADASRGAETFNNLFILDSFARFVKILVIIGSGLALVLSVSSLEKDKADRFEYPVLVMLSTLGMMLMVSAGDMMTLYMGLELQSLPLYVLAAFQRDHLRSSEAGLKYFVLGALSSGLLLYGISLVYGSTGTTSFVGIENSIAQAMGDFPIGLIVGLVFVLSGLAFKVSAVPFHMWTPDVYEGAPTPVTAFFSMAPKVAAVALLVRVVSGPFGDMFEQWRQVLVVLSAASMIIGALAAIAQTNVKRLMAYSSIGHVGYVLIAVAAGTADSLQAVLIYLLIYMVMNAGAFAIILTLRRDGQPAEEISDFSGLSRARPMLALAMAILMFSMSGIPPMAGFFGKLFVFKAAVAAGMFKLAILGVLASVILAYYYLRIIKLMYFDAPAPDLDRDSVTPELRCVAFLSIVFVLLFIFFPHAVLLTAQAAAASLGLS